MECTYWNTPNGIKPLTAYHKCAYNRKNPLEEFVMEILSNLFAFAFFYFFTLAFYFTFFGPGNFICGKKQIESMG